MRNHSSYLRCCWYFGIAVVPLLVLSLGAATPSGGGCCIPKPIDMTQFLLRPAASGPCTPTKCQNEADTLACAVSLGCADDRCKFAVESDASCMCFETDFRACPDSTGIAQACVRTSATSTIWQVDNGHPMCGPSQLDCATGRPACPAGHIGTKYDPATATWVRDPQGTCTPEPACPATGATRTCRTGIARCPDGIQHFDGNAWSTTCEPQNCPSCVANEGARCGCGGTIQCNGTCSNPGPSNLGAGCGCGGTIQCNGTCSNPGPSNLGAGCGCGGTIQCNGICSRACPTPRPLNALFSNIDDDAYVWLDHPGSMDQAICSINAGGVPRSGQCDLRGALQAHGVTSGRLVFKIGNGGGFNSKGTIRLTDQTGERWRGDEIDNGWKHTGWTYCAKVDVDLISGKVELWCTDSCANWLDCDNECSFCLRPPNSL